MRVLLQSTKTQLLFKGAGQWTDNSAEAEDFQSSARACEYSWEHGLREMQVVLSFEKPLYDLTIQIPEPPLGLQSTNLWARSPDLEPETAQPDFARPRIYEGKRFGAG
jgi:hypothetical protein